MTTIPGWIGVDSHVHLGSFAQPGPTLNATLAAGVRLVVATELPSEYRRLAGQLPLSDAVQLGLGFHPLHAGVPTLSDELAVLREQFATARWLSEIGLDGFFAAHDGPALSVQERVLEQIFALGVTDKILSVHSRDAEDRCVDLVRAARPAAAIFHWYDGTVSQAATVADAGFYFSVNAFMVGSEPHRELLRWLPRELILTETDGPTTTMADGRGCVPSDVLEIAGLLADIRGESASELRAQIVVNTCRLEASV